MPLSDVTYKSNDNNKKQIDLHLKNYFRRKNGGKIFH